MGTRESTCAILSTSLSAGFLSTPLCWRFAIDGHFCLLFFFLMGDGRKPDLPPDAVRRGGLSGMKGQYGKSYVWGVAVASPTGTYIPRATVGVRVCWRHCVILSGMKGQYGKSYVWDRLALP